jgi:TonB family protein
MKRLNYAVIVALVCVAVSYAENRGNCPVSPPLNTKDLKKSEPPVSTDPEKRYFGTVSLVAVISDKGYVCSARVARGVDKQTDKKAETAVREWHFSPAQRNGHPTVVLVRIDVNYWKNSSGEIVNDPPQLPGEETKQD